MAGDGATTTTATQTNGDGGAAEAQTTAGGFDTSGIEQQLQAVGQGQEELRQFVAQLAERFPAEGEEPGQEPEPIDLTQFLGDDDAYADTDPREQRAQALQQAIDSLVEQRVQQIVGPLQEQLGEMRSEVEMDRLVAEFPVLGENPQAAEQVVQASHAIAASNGWPAQVANHPQFLRLNTLAAIGARALQDEGQQQEGADDGAQALEAPGGAAPAAGDVSKAIFEPRGRKVLPF